MSDRRLAAAILDIMEEERAYEATALKAMFPDISMDTLREALHVLWIERRVERVGTSGWRRFESTWDGRPAAASSSSQQPRA